MPEGLGCVREVECAAWRLGEVEVERVEELLRLEVFCVFVTGVEIESPKGDLVGDAWFVLYPVETAVAVVVIATAGTPTDQVARCFATAGRSECWEMIAHGKVIELTSGRWKEIWLGQRGCVLVRLPPVGFGRYSRCLPSSLWCISCMPASSVMRSDRNLRSRKLRWTCRGLFGMLNYFYGGGRGSCLCTQSLRVTRLTKPITITDCHKQSRNPVPSARSSCQLITEDGFF